jgi:phosphoglycolate phosphatase
MASRGTSVDGECAGRIRERFDGIVFDLDGTLVDTAPDILAYLNDMLIELGRPDLALDRVRPMIGDGVRALLIRGLEASGGVPDDLDIDALFHRYLHRYAKEPVRTGRPYPGMVDLLEALASSGVRMGVCTNKPQAPADRLLRMLDLDRFFPAVIGGDALPLKKPDAAHLLAVLERLDVKPERATLVGDSAIDLETARAAGIPCILVSYGYTAIPAAALGADRVVDRAADLAAALTSLGTPPGSLDIPEAGPL